MLLDSCIHYMCYAKIKKTQQRKIKRYDKYDEFLLYKFRYSGNYLIIIKKTLHDMTKPCCRYNFIDLVSYVHSQSRNLISLSTINLLQEKPCNCFCLYYIIYTRKNKQNTDQFPVVVQAIYLCRYTHR